MELKALKPRKSLNKAFLKLKPNRADIETFKTNLIELIDRSNPNESEEFHKNLVAAFLNRTYYHPDFFVNTKGRNDLVIYNGKDSKSSVGVIVEAKKSSNKSEMLSLDNINVKAFHELILYYLRERISEKNLDIKHIIATNINEWFVFEANVFEKLFANNKNLVKQFTDFEEGRLSGKTTDFFYSEIARPFVESIKSEIAFTYFDLREYEKPLRNDDKKDDTKLIALFKLFSPEHLLKLPFANDSNSLDKRFYSELLHIIGLTETKKGSKKLIERKPENERNYGSILENAIIQLDSLDKISRLENPRQYGANMQERLFAVGLELSITWINRILFLKLLEAQLIKYHKGNKEYAFLNLDRINNYDDLNTLFFQVLAKKHEDRNHKVKDLYEKVPFLNSSLFEPNDLEHTTLLISNLSDDDKISILPSTVLRDSTGKKRTGELTTLEYLFEFLNAYDFSSEGAEDIQEDNKTLINASVLGLIFEKINGYKDGSFFTPGFITMYMCRETIRRAVLQKFNEATAGKPPPLERGHGGVSNPPTGNGGVSSPHTRASKRHIIPYNPILKEYARKLRNKCTKSEAILWKQLKGKFENKYDFHRQKPLDNYIADFFCYELALVIELDGESHNSEETKQKDIEKEKSFNELGLNVLRFKDDQVFEDLDGLIDSLVEYVNGFEKGDLSGFKRDDTPLNPLSKGDFSHTLPGKSPSKDKFQSLNDVYNEIGTDGIFSVEQANNIVNSIKICDPAVGSGHFLVSALNEIIAVKNDLKILTDRQGKRLKYYNIEVVNDELIVTDEDGELFEYNPSSKESQRIQETLFHEKQTIIENCLFGVDINPNSVKICRLRLWIELLKNAYYKNQTELETLPNIDINIKCGNSLVSRFSLDSDLKRALNKFKWNIDTYRLAVQTYRNAENKEQKHEMEKLIKTIKSDFRTEIAANSKEIRDLSKWRGELGNLQSQTTLFEKTAKEKKEFNKKAQALTEKIKKQENLIEEIKNNKIYENAFEWRFEFPEVLNDDGDFVGFDVVIGNPPYMLVDNKSKLGIVLNLNFKYSYGKSDLYRFFIELGHLILKQNGHFSYIVPSSFLNIPGCKKLREFLLKDNAILEIIQFYGQVFDEASVNSLILHTKKNISDSQVKVIVDNFEIADSMSLNKALQNSFKVDKDYWLRSSNFAIKTNVKNLEFEILIKIMRNCINLKEICDYTLGLQAYHNSKHSSQQIKERFLHSKEKISDKYYPEVGGRQVKRFYFDSRIKEFVKYSDDCYNYPPYEFCSEKRIYIREILSPDGIVSSIIDKGLENIPNKSIIAIIPHNILDIEYLLGILNSKLIKFYIEKTTEKGNQRLFPRISLTTVSELPIKRIENSSITAIKISEKVKIILDLKKRNLDTDCSILESEIDRLVYELYDLSDEEIGIVENSIK